MPEQVETPGKSETAPGFKNMHEAMDKYAADQEAAASAAVEARVTAPEKAKEEPAKVTEPVTEPEKAPAPVATAPKYKIVDEKGNPVPFVIKVDGEEIPVEDLEKLKTYAQFGYHHNKRGEELNQRDAALKASEAEVRDAIELAREIRVAQKEGRLKVLQPGETEAPAKAGKPAVETEEEDDTFTDPQVQKERQARKALEAKVNSMVEELNQAKAIVLEMAKSKLLTEMKTGIAKAKETYKNADDQEVWLLLAEKNADGSMVHTPESAVKASHEKALARFQEHLKEHPELTEIPKEKKDAIIAEYLKEKSAKEVAPVGKPSPSPAPTPVPAKREFKNMREAVAAIQEDGILNRPKGADQA